MKTVFVAEIPEVLEDGILYVSYECRVALHNCACGCGEEVSTPLVPTEYNLTLDGDEASISPSVGNHDFACASHYVIERGKIVWAGKMSRAVIEAGRRHDRELKRPTKHASETPMRISSLAVRSLRRFRDWLVALQHKLFG